MAKEHNNKARRVVDEHGQSIAIDDSTRSVVAGLKGKSPNSPLEHTINAAACAAINAIPGAHACKMVGTVYGQTGQPDIIACYKGRLYCLEGKVRRKEKSPICDVKPRQRATLRQWCAAGARIGIYTSAEEAAAMVVAAWNVNPGKDDYWLWYGSRGNEIWTHVDNIPVRE